MQACHSLQGQLLLVQLVKDLICILDAATQLQPGKTFVILYLTLMSKMRNCYK